MKSIHLLLMSAAVLLAGCPVTQPQDTPVDAQGVTVPRTETSAKLYVPSYYNEDRQWPLVVTLHGTYGWDGHRRQVMEWKALAEEHGFIVAAPQLESTQGILPLIPGMWEKDLAEDEQTILSLIDHLAGRYRIDTDHVLLTGFSAGGYPMYYTGLRNPERFDMLIARAANCRIDLLEKIELTDAVRKLPVFIYVGKSDLKPLRDQSWEAFRYLRQRGCRLVEREDAEGGHLRRPGIAWEQWAKRLPETYRNAGR
ncbi:MAG: alpha/beta hydrolase-fold protein [Planctomycetota bacterium]